MSTTYSGDPSNTSSSTTKNINGATNASPIVVTTATAHGFYTGDRVRVAGVAGNTAANGDWSIVVTGSTTLQLVGSTGNGAYSAGSDTIECLSLRPALTIPSDGQGPIKAADINPAFQALEDKIQALDERTGPHVSMVWQPPTYVSLGTDWQGQGRYLEKSANSSGAQFVPLTAIPDGARLESVEPVFRVATGHAGVPATLPRVYIIRYACADGDSFAASQLYSGGGFGEFVMPTPADVTAYEAGGDVQSFVATCDQNNTIDLSAFVYTVLFEPESSANALSGTKLIGFRLNFARSNWPRVTA